MKAILTTPQSTTKEPMLLSLQLLRPRSVSAYLLSRMGNLKARWFTEMTRFFACFRLLASALPAGQSATYLQHVWTAHPPRMTGVWCRASSCRPRAIRTSPSLGEAPSFRYVDDLISGLIAMRETGPEVNPVEFTIRELARLILELTARALKSFTGPSARRSAKAAVLASVRLNGCCGPTISLREGLTKTITYLERLIARA